MSQAAIEALRVEQAHAKQLFQSLSPQEWAAPSGCTDWRVQDVACHMASVFHLIADASTIEGGAGTDAEADAEVPVQARKDWTPEQVMAEYDQWSDAGIATLAAMQDPAMADMVIPMANLGSHPMHILANAIVFDHYCHMRHDIGAAVERAASLPHDEAALMATLEWMLAGVPQMCAEALAAAPHQTVNLVFEGSAASAWTLVPGDALWSVTSGVAPGQPTFTSTAHAFVSWGTKRADWREHGVLSGDHSGDAAAVLDAINVI
jgi:uncharacterized protein (TIGR03083 family)